ncbi:hypothetical protein BKA70DRAFT_1397419 [Coprinopsis sp. MPI-PUGE-AT-0042]|nr:hypothetical protein BKA70DRAFT_1397419 [Coprinopsis sp. MPI-PUGE-AT-0042]
MRKSPPVFGVSDDPELQQSLAAATPLLPIPELFLAYRTFTQTDAKMLHNETRRRKPPPSAKSSLRLSQPKQTIDDRFREKGFLSLSGRNGIWLEGEDMSVPWCGGSGCAQTLSFSTEGSGGYASLGREGVVEGSIQLSLTRSLMNGSKPRDLCYWEVLQASKVTYPHPPSNPAICADHISLQRGSKRSPTPLSRCLSRPHPLLLQLNQPSLLSEITYSLKSLNQGAIKHLEIRRKLLNRATRYSRST